MEIKLEPILRDEKSVFIQLMNLYKYDFTEWQPEDINDHGFYNYGYTDYWWNDEDRHPFFIRADNKLAGFVLVKDSAFEYISDDGNAHKINEFFVMKKYRRAGVGSYAATAAFDMYRGRWEVTHLPYNVPAKNFWKSVVSKYTNGNYQECGSENDEWMGFAFDNSK